MNDNPLKKFFFNVMTSGKSFDGMDEARMDSLVRYILLNSLIFMGGSLLFIFGFENLSTGLYAAAFFDILMGCTTLLGFVVLRTNAPFIVSGLLTVVPFMFLCAFFAQSGGAQGSGVLWSYSFPMMAIFLLGMKAGIILSSMLFVFIGLSVFLPGFSMMTFETSFAFRTVAVYALVLACTIVYEQTKIVKDRWVARLTSALKAERDEVTAMKDNLKDGVFMMDADFIIQPRYSRALGGILSEESLAGRSFLELLSSSVQQKERETLHDYFQMVINRSYDAQMLEDINPLHQFLYVHPATGERKNLRCSFVSVDRDKGQVLILGTIHDSTVEVELQAQLSEEESKRQEEMHSLFEVIHVEPRVLNDFIEDAEHEFDRINAILKDQSLDSSKIMVQIYQCVHAIKSNAVILGLKRFAAKLHLLEDVIRDLREQEAVSFEEILHITVELDKLMKIKDGYRNLIDRIKAFNFGSDRMQEEQVLVQTLERVVSKAAEDLGKKAHLTVSAIDPRALSQGPRRAMKEILTQLIRNAVYHGIETPELREQYGKESSGSIELSITMKNDTIGINLSDDGKGLDFDAIREKAQSMKLIYDPEQLKDKNVLTRVLFSPGFSTAGEADMHAGRGVGLSLVRDRLKELKGAVKLLTEPGKGTTFKIVLPAEAAASSGVRTA